MSIDHALNRLIYKVETPLCDFINELDADNADVKAALNTLHAALLDGMIKVGQQISAARREST